MGYIIAQGAQHRFRWRNVHSLNPFKLSGQVEGCQESCRHIADVSLNTRDLPGKIKLRLARENAWWDLEQRWRVKKSIAMHLAHSNEVGVFQTRNQAQNLFLLFPTDIRLEADDIVKIACQIILPQLHDGVRPLDRYADSVKPTGRMGPKARVSSAALRQLLRSVHSLRRS